MRTVLVERKVSEPGLLRGFAFSKCLAEGYKESNPELSKEAMRVAEAYREASSTARPEVFERLDVLAQESKPGTRAPLDGANLAIMRCLEFYEGSALRKAVTKSRK